MEDLSRKVRPKKFLLVSHLLATALSLAVPLAVPPALPLAPEVPLAVSAALLGSSGSGQRLDASILKADILYQDRAKQKDQIYY